MTIAPFEDQMVSDVARLAGGRSYRFADWPNPEVPNWRAGVYGIWHDDGALLYVGMAGRSLRADIEDTRHLRRRSTGSAKASSTG